MNQSHTLEVKGMTCASCANTVTKALQRRGLSNVSVNHASGEVYFEAVEETPLTPVYDAINNLGYQSVRPEDAAHTDGHAGHEHGGNLADRLLPFCVLLTVPLLAHMAFSWPLLHNVWFQLALSTPVFLMGWVVFGRSSIQSLRHGAPNMNVLILLGATAAYGYSLRSLFGKGHDFMFFETAASIITLVMLGNWLEHRTARATNRSVEALTKLPRKPRGWCSVTASDENR